MKKITNLIIFFSLIFSSLSTTFAEEWYIEKVLNLNFAKQEYSINLEKIEYVNFSTSYNKRMYDNIKKANNTLKDSFIAKYKSWEYEYYQINGIIKNYSNFIYHTNNLFYFLKIRERGCDYKELDTAIIRSYTNMKSSFTKVRNIVK